MNGGSNYDVLEEAKKVRHISVTRMIKDARDCEHEVQSP